MDAFVGYNKELHIAIVIKLPVALKEMNELRRGFSVIILLAVHLTSGKCEGEIPKIVAPSQIGVILL